MTRQPPKVPDVIDPLTVVLHGAPALPGALCRGEHELFDSDEPSDVEAAIELCSWCPCARRCRAWVDTLSANSVSGVVAGRVLTCTQQKMRRPQKAVAARPRGRPRKATA
jgi:hypothetical protein